MASRRSRTRRTVAATAAAIATSGLVAASAASLGAVTQDSLGATVSTTAACQTSGLTIAWNAPGHSNGNPNYRVKGLSINNVDGLTGEDCDGLNYRVVVLDSNDDALNSPDASGTINNQASIPVTLAPTVDAEDIESVSLTIYE